MHQPWNAVVDEVLQASGGLATRQALLARVPRTVLDSFVGRGQLCRVFPSVYTARGNPATADRRLRAALLCAGDGAVLSHTTALAVRGVGEHRGPVHVTIDHDRRHAGAADLRVHRRRRLHGPDEQHGTVRGMPTTSLAASLVDSWPLLPPPERRPLLLELARTGQVDVDDLAAAVRRRPNVTGHRQLAECVGLVADGVQSELEALGVLHVFQHPSLPRSRGQVRVDCPDGVVRWLDRAWKAAKLAVELDGAAFHTSPEDRRKDLHRDAVLAAMGWLVLRFTYAEVLHDPEAVRAKVRAVLDVRLAQLGAA